MRETMAKAKCNPNIETGSFDYSALSAEVAVAARDAASRIRLRLKKTIQDIIETGQDLIETKAQIGHGHFLKWIDIEFGMRTTMNDSEAADDKNRRYYFTVIEILQWLGLVPAAVLSLVSGYTDWSCGHPVPSLASYANTKVNDCGHGRQSMFNACR